MKVRLGPANFAIGEMRGFEIGKQNIVVVRVGSGYRALDDWCNHAGCLLSGGRIERNMVVCPCHEVGFDLESGRNVTSPGVCGDQRAFRVSVQNGDLFLEDFDPEL
jgi:3-phenylpropionate/trans-cinnamate dioxygenase ferredoxin subunit